MDRGTWRTSVHGVSKSRTRLNDYAQAQSRLTEKMNKVFGQPSVNFLVYNIVILCFYTLHDDDQDTSSYRSSPYNVSAISWTLFPSLYVASP